MSIRAVIFDFDGVILESADIKTDAFVELFSDLPVDQVARVRDHHLANMGISRYAKFAWIYRAVLGREITADESAELGERFSALVFSKVLAAPFVLGADRALQTLSQTMPLFVASGTPQQELDLIVDDRGIRSHFTEVWGSPRGKGEIIEDVRSRHRLAAQDVLFVGDGMSDYNAAHATGVRFLARDTPALHDAWVGLGVARACDLTKLVDLVEASR